MISFINGLAKVRKGKKIRLLRALPQYENNRPTYVCSQNVRVYMCVCNKSI
jgi:hypothetical protein